MEMFWQELTFGLFDVRQLIQIIVRLTAAAILGGIIGFQRQRAKKPAGLRTHILVSLGTTVFVLACSKAGMTSDGLSRVIQGIVTGIGFLGAGSILKLNQAQDIKGLTTAAGIWMTSAIGVAVGLGSMGVAILSTIFALIVLTLIVPLEEQIRKRQIAKDKEANDQSI